MKNKKMTYILLPLVIIIWGAIVYRIIVYYMGDDPVNITKESNDYAAMKLNNKDTFSLLINYQDPFLKNALSITPTVTIVHTPVAKSPIVNKEKKDNAPVSWPTIIYCGLIKNKESNKSCSIIKINNSEHLMIVGDTYSEVTLLMIYKDSAVVQYKNIKKTIVK
jgi:hypothetical protein